jgi:short-subunit dehydrogenase
MSFANRVAVITGASSGIGRALAVALAARGARVGVTARRADRLDELTREVRAAGGTIEAAACDITDRAATLAAVRGLADRLGPVDLMIANAGLGQTAGADPMNVPVFEQMVKVNVLGVAYSFEAVMESMLARRSGHLVAISSLAAYKGLPNSAGYCATKAAVNTYCEGLRIELHGRGVAVTCVCPGFVRTEMTAGKTHPMPLVMGADRAAARILGALARRPKVYNFPRRMAFLMKLTRWLPDWFVARNARHD